MKRYVFVPAFLLDGKGNMPEDATRISNIAKLPIRIGQNGEFPHIKNIEIICTPEKISMKFDRKVESNFLQTIIFENEFTHFTKKTECVIEYQDKKCIILPRIAEKHCVKFKHRFNDTGIYKYYIINNNKVVSEEYFFEVV
jgi:hypothetical protein